jgi:tetratricopeptide (TPR) repeat protein
MTRAVNKSPGARFPSCGIFVAALERAFSGAAEEPTTPTTTMSIPRQRASRMPIVAAATGTVVLAGGVFLWHPWVQPPKQQSTQVDAPPTKAAIVPESPAPPVAPKKTAVAPAAAARSESEPAAADRSDGLEQARKLNESGDATGALQAVNQVLAIHPRSGMALAFRGELHQKAKQWEAAAADYGKALRVMPRHALAHLHRGVCLVQMH